MIKANVQYPPALPYLPNEVKIRILSYVDDPEFLWTSCRWVSQAFRQWSEEQYAREHLPQLRLEMHLTPCSWTPPKEIEYQYLTYTLQRTEILFFAEKLDPTNTARALLKPQGLPFSTLRPTLRGAPERKITRDDDLQLLTEVSQYVVRCQVYPEIALGLRPAGQGYVCPCRSLKDATKRGFCKRYVGAEAFFTWNSEDRALELSWKELLDYVHNRSCRSTTKR